MSKKGTSLCEMSECEILCVHTQDLTQKSKWKFKDVELANSKRKKNFRSSEAEAPLQEVNSQWSSYLVVSVVDIRNHKNTQLK